MVTFASGDAELAEKMFAEIQELEPGRRHILVTPAEVGAGSPFAIYRRLRKRFRRQRIGLAPVLFTKDLRYRAIRGAAFLLAPTKILAYNGRLERHHLRLRTGIASWLFLRGVALDRIFLRPKWLVPWKKDRSIYPSNVQEMVGRPMAARRRRVAVVSPYFPYPLSHGGAVRIFNLLREMAGEMDVFPFCVSRSGDGWRFRARVGALRSRDFVGKTRYREPRWSTLLPPEVHEFRSPAMLAAIERVRRNTRSKPCRWNIRCWLRMAAMCWWSTT